MASLKALRAGLATRLATIDGLNAYASIPDDITAPAAVVEVEAISYLGTFDGHYDYGLVVQLFVQNSAPGSTGTGEDQLSGYLDSTGATSVKAAVEADESLGGIAQITGVTAMRNYGVVEYAGVSYLSCELVVGVSV